MMAAPLLENEKKEEDTEENENPLVVGAEAEETVMILGGIDRQKGLRGVLRDLKRLGPRWWCLKRKGKGGLVVILTLQMMMMMAKDEEEVEGAGVEAVVRGQGVEERIHAVTLEVQHAIVMRTSMAEKPVSLPRWWRRRRRGLANF